MKNFMEKYNVSRETFDKLKTYQQLLNEWQEKFNLVSNNSLPEAWERHFVDSAQLWKFVPEKAESLLDFGSGAGFPGLVLAVIAKEKTPYLKVGLAESIAKKTLFLKAVSEKAGIDVEIINDRIENIPARKVDVITSRAMTSLNGLLGYAYRFCKLETVCIFPKGKKYAEELAEAHRHWKFKCRIESSEVSDEGRILIITNLSKVKGDKHA